MGRQYSVITDQGLDCLCLTINHNYTDAYNACVKWGKGYSLWNFF